ncbi:RdgB/HAM1 family non-canonical purine NTP pyrophosphatase [Methyloferula stellata]|uniref:RdgB/HAM1 family non-canonical purine NTP pyrophosphatase n=1 Tax=Methyloferula stellata TaxID=876270 RepID=UPI00036AEAD2|nr:RdgB/HAM1 family non-canonical purine NTP pyrophosphatase [Methyloferula stellata]
MPRLIEGKLVIATHNPGKLWEIATLLKPYGIDAVSAGDLGLPEPEETGLTFIANAELKALASAKGSGLPAIADDSGLCVDALDGAPGIYSARYAGESRDFAFAMQKLEKEIADRGATPPFHAHFVSAISLAWPDGKTLSFEGKVFGTLVFPPRGGLGFGYDPVFLPNGHDKTFGEMWAVEKHSIPVDGSEALSHRARAFQAFAKTCLE